MFMEKILLFGCKPPASSEFSLNLACEWPVLFLALHLLIYFLARADIMDHKILIKYLLCCLKTYSVKPLVYLRKLQIGLYKLTLFSFDNYFYVFYFTFKRNVTQDFILRGLNYYSVLQNTGIV